MVEKEEVVMVAAKRWRQQRRAKAGSMVRAAMRVATVAALRASSRARAVVETEGRWCRWRWRRGASAEMAVVMELG